MAKAKKKLVAPKLLYGQLYNNNGHTYVDPVPPSHMPSYDGHVLVVYKLVGRRRVRVKVSIK